MKRLCRPSGADSPSDGLTQRLKRWAKMWRRSAPLSIKDRSFTFTNTALETLR